MSTYHRASGRARLRAVPTRTQPVPAEEAAPKPPGNPDPTLAVCAALGEVQNEEVLVIGPHGLEVTCDLIRRGARSVTLLRTDKRPEAHSASLVVVPEAPSLEWLACVLGHARRALLPTGRLVLRVGSLAGRQIVAQITRMLRVHGYSDIHARHAGNELLLNAQMPGFGHKMHA